VKYFKITKSWSVRAEDEDSAMKLVAEDPEKYLDSKSVQRTEYRQRQQQKSGNGWVTAAKDQLLGSNSRPSR
jgi:hypothetical protein